MSEGQDDIARHSAEFRERQRLEHKQSLADMEAVLATPQGYRVVLEILRAARVLQPTFASDAMISAYNEGWRNMGLRIARAVADASGAIAARMVVELLQEKADART